MIIVSAKPIIFISYSHKDEPEQPREGEEPWLSFVRTYLQPSIKDGIFDLWVDSHMVGGTIWDSEIESKLRACDIFILLVSAHSMASDYIVDKEIAIIRERQTAGDDVHFYPLLLTPTPDAGLDKVRDTNLRPRDAKPFSSLPPNDRMQQMTDAANEIASIAQKIVDRKGAPSIARPSIRPAHVQISGLPETPYERLVGREADLKKLDNAWASRTTNVISLIAEGGAGKTALLNEWLKRLQAEEYRGAEAVLAWSFYSQGTKERATSADAFLNWALARLGLKLDSSNATAKAEAIAEAMMQRRVLLLIDGVEPLQHGLDPQLGQLKDQGLRVLLRRFAAAPPGEAHGLTVLTSRLTVKDIARWRKSAAPIANVGRLSDAAGAALLRDNGVWSIDKELHAAARDFEGHPLALSLLASFLKETQKGDVRRRDHIRQILNDTENPGHDHARRIMESYEKEWLADQPILLAIMRIVGLFDRPATDDCIRAVLDNPPISAFDDPINDLSHDEWNRAVERLRSARLLAPTDPTASDSLDAHPLVREWFGERFRQTNEGAWRAANGELYKHLRDTTKEGKTPTLEDLSPLYQAIAHGCRAGLHSEVFEEIYRERISRRLPNSRQPENYSVGRLGAVGSDLAALTWFFEEPFEVLVDTLRTTDQKSVQRLTSNRLRAQGRLAEALPIQYVQLNDLDLAYGTKHLSNRAKHLIARTLMNVSRLEATVGHLAIAEKTALRAVQLADGISHIPGYSFTGTRARICLAEVLYSKGDVIAAERMFLSAKRNYKKKHPKYRLPWPYDYLLLEKSDWSSASDRAQFVLNDVTAMNSNLVIGTQTLTLCRSGLGAQLDATNSSETNFSCSKVAAIAGQFDEAVEHLRAAEDVTQIPLSLLARATFGRSIGNWIGAARDLDEAEEIAEPGPMRLHLCDLALGRARLAFARIEGFVPLNGALEKDSPERSKRPNEAEKSRLHEEAKEQLRIAQDYISAFGYHLRDMELAELLEVLSGGRGFSDLPPRV